MLWLKPQIPHNPQPSQTTPVASHRLSLLQLLPALVVTHGGVVMLHGRKLAAALLPEVFREAAL